MKITESVTKVTLYDHESAWRHTLGGVDPNRLQLRDVLDRIVSLWEGLEHFWGRSEGWAPDSAADLLGSVRLDWLVSLSRTLAIWIESPRPEETQARLILAWVNLGCLVEGTLKLFLSVHLETYRSDLQAIRKGENIADPDGLTLDPLRRFFNSRVWDSGLNHWAELVQRRRNAIHAYQDKDIGTWDEYAQALRAYLLMLRYVDWRLPYPDEKYRPQEVNFSVQQDPELPF